MGRLHTKHTAGEDMAVSKWPSNWSQFCAVQTASVLAEQSKRKETTSAATAQQQLLVLKVLQQWRPPVPRGPHPAGLFSFSLSVQTESCSFSFCLPSTSTPSFYPFSCALLSAELQVSPLAGPPQSIPARLSKLKHLRFGAWRTKSRKWRLIASSLHALGRNQDQSCVHQQQVNVLKLCIFRWVKDCQRYKMSEAIDRW